MQDYHEDGCGEHRSESEAERGSLRRGRVFDPDSKRSVLVTANDSRCHHQPCEGRRPHVGEELHAVEMKVAEDDQVGQVGARQEQRPSIGEEQAAVEQRCFAFATAPRRIDEDRGEESHRSVEIQHRRHHAHHGDGTHEEEHTARSGAGQTVARRGEQAIFVGNQADQEQPGNEDERCPVLGSRGPGCRRVQRSGDQQSGHADAGESPTKQTLTVAASFQGHCVGIHRLRIDHSPKLGLLTEGARRRL